MSSGSALHDTTMSYRLGCKLASLLGLPVPHFWREQFHGALHMMQSFSEKSLYVLALLRVQHRATMLFAGDGMTLSCFQAGMVFLYSCRVIH